MACTKFRKLLMCCFGRQTKKKGLVEADEAYGIEKKTENYISKPPVTFQDDEKQGGREFFHHEDATSFLCCSGTRKRGEHYVSVIPDPMTPAPMRKNISILKHPNAVIEEENMVRCGDNLGTISRPRKYPPSFGPPEEIPWKMPPFPRERIPDEDLRPHWKGIEVSDGERRNYWKGMVVPAVIETPIVLTNSENLVVSNQPLVVSESVEFIGDNEINDVCLGASANGNRVSAPKTDETSTKAVTREGGKPINVAIGGDDALAVGGNEAVNTSSMESTISNPPATTSGPSIDSIAPVPPKNEQQSTSTSTTSVLIPTYSPTTSHTLREKLFERARMNFFSRKLGCKSPYAALYSPNTDVSPFSQYLQPFGIFSYDPFIQQPGMQQQIGVTTQYGIPFGLQSPYMQPNMSFQKTEYGIAEMGVGQYGRLPFILRPGVFELLGDISQQLEGGDRLASTLINTQQGHNNRTAEVQDDTTDIGPLGIQAQDCSADTVPPMEPNKFPECDAVCPEPGI